MSRTIEKRSFFIEVSVSPSSIARWERAEQSDGKPDAVELALADFCQALTGLNEFVYIE